jgi:hypothetical protein
MDAGKEKIMSSFVTIVRLIRSLIYVVVACLLILPLQVSAESCTDNDKNVVRVTGPTVVFYSLTQTQFDLLSSDDQAAYTELLSDFYEYSSRLSHYLDKYHLQHILTGTRYIEIKGGKDTYCFDKMTFK